MFASIITCIYNQDLILFNECVQSVFSLKGSHQVEWIIVDDYSDDNYSDGYQTLLNEFIPTANLDVRLIKLNTNSGLSKARNQGLKKATGQFIIILDSDDLLPDDLLNSLDKNSKFKLFCYEVEYFNNTKREHRRLGFFKDNFHLYGNTALCPFFWFDFYYHGLVASAILFEKYGNYDETLFCGEDQDILIRFTQSVERAEITFIDKVGYYYRINPNGICATNWISVKRGYEQSMLRLMQTVNSEITACRFGNVTIIESSEIDCYEYYHKKFGWMNWFDAKTILK